MAYAKTVVLTSVGHDNGRPCFALTITETECATASEWDTSTAVDGNGNRVTLPKQIRIVSQKVNITAGTAMQVAPVMARVTGITAIGPNSVSVQAVAAAIDDASCYSRYLPGQVLYGRSQPQGVSTDNSITTEILFVQGWES